VFFLSNQSRGIEKDIIKQIIAPVRCWIVNNILIIAEYAIILLHILQFGYIIGFGGGFDEQI